VTITECAATRGLEERQQQGFHEDLMMKGLRIKHILDKTPVGETVSISGWLRTRRDSKAGFSFLEVNDGSCLQGIQVLASTDLAEYDSVVKELTTGSALSVNGVLKESPGRGQRVELEARTIVALGSAPPDYPLQKKKHTLEYLREIAHLRPRTNTLGAAMRLRHHLSFAIHDYFRQNDFFYIHTPIITASDCEGAGAMFRVSTLDPKSPPTDGQGEIRWQKDFFGRKTYLTVSGQLQAEAMACALGRVYTFGPTFRAENSHTPRHVAEFWMVEPEVAFADLDLNAELAEDFLKSTLKYALEHCAEDLTFFDDRVEKGLIASLEGVVASSFERMTYSDAVERLLASGRAFEHEVIWGLPLQTEHERYLTEELLQKPVILTDYPADKAAFYMRLNDDGKTAAAMDVLVPRIGEIIGGSQREERYDVLLDRLAQHHLSAEEYWWYTDLRKHGTVPHAGFGLGFERLVMFASGMKNIRDVIAFPRTPKQADF
jgi:asparaginyl-tRNA synthetase